MKDFREGVPLFTNPPDGPIYASETMSAACVVGARRSRV